MAILRAPAAGRVMTVTVSELTAAQYARDLAAPGVAVLVRRGSKILEIEQVRRYHHPIGLIRLDIDDFKAVNNTDGHPQGDAVLRHVARVLQENSRDADSPARYRGEELSLILPHTDLEGAHAIAERIRAAVESLRVPSTNGHGVLRITASPA